MINKFRLISIILLASFSFHLQGQVSITFKLNMKSLVEQGLFSPQKGEKICVRGSFNEWNDNTYELKNPSDVEIFAETFRIEAKIGDTIEYKYIIVRADEKIYWENKPNLHNRENGNRQLIIASKNLILPADTFSYDEFISFPVVFSKKKLREDYIQFRNVLEDNHPALYDYSSKATIDSLFERQYSLIQNEMALNDYYKLLSSVISKIGCGHTKLWIPGKYWDVTPEKLFPFKLYLSKNRILISGSYSTVNDTPVGSEVIAINGQPIWEIFDSLVSIESADGQNMAFKFKTVEKNFSKKYALYFGFPERFEITYVAPDESNKRHASLKPVGVDTINKFDTKENELSLKELPEYNTAILTINTFSYYSEVDMFQSFIDSTFQLIKEKKISNLIMDLRGNDGGDPFCSSYLFSYLEPKPLPYFAEPYGKYTPLADPIPMAENHFTGKLYTLIDGRCFSTTGHFTSLLKYHKIGKFVGSETGANYTCTGNVMYPIFKNTKLFVGTARVNRYSTAVSNMDRTRGVLPDYEVVKSQQDIIENKDAVFEYAISLIK